MRVCVVWDLVPEETQIYVLDLSEQEYESVRRAHGCILNLMGQPKEAEDAAARLNELLEGRDQHWDEPPENISRVIVSGFAL